MKIYIVSIQFIPHITGGGGVVVRDLALELIKAGDDVTILTLGLDDIEKEKIIIFENGNRYLVDVQRFFTSDSKIISNPYEGTKEEEFQRFEQFTDQVFEYLKNKEGVIHLHGHYIVPALAKRVKVEGRGNPVITTFSALESVSSEVKHVISNYALEYIKKGEELGLKFSDYVIVNSETIKNQLKQMYPKAFLEKKVLVVPNFVSNDHLYTNESYNQDVIEIKKKFGIKNHHPLIFHIGRFDKIKGIEYLIKAMKIVAPKYKKYLTVLIVGFLENKEKEYYNYLSGLAKNIMCEHKNIDILLYPGYVDINHRICLLDICSFFVTPAILEPFGLTTLEAWARGKPVIRSDNEGSRYLFNLNGKITAPFEKKDMGLIVNFDSNRTENLATAILELLENPEDIKKMGAIGKKIVSERFSAANTMKFYRNLYEKT
ncbi:MAG: glycosyltransferase family 4 protein [Candidatus Helarchaeota archaeon]